MKFDIYTDGSCKGNPGPGGWAFVIVHRGNLLIKQSSPLRNTTNNKAELLAIINALLGLSKLKQSKQVTLVIYTDSKYVANAFNLKWIEAWLARNFDNVKNERHWRLLIKLISNFKHVKFVWVKGHSDNEFNNIVDELACNASKLAYNLNKQSKK
jgi:ribonuclease HI|nr:MAG TPA: ribonuclease HI [Caudoviricetes sp.]